MSKEPTQPESRGRDRERLRLMLDELPAVVWMVDRDLHFTSSAGAGLTALGLRSDEVVGQTLFGYFQTDDPGFPPIAAHLRALAGDASGYEIEWLGRWFDCRVEPYRDAEGTIVGAIGVAFDTTARRQAEDSLRRSERRYRSLFEESRDAIYISALDGTLIDFNQAMVDLFGYTREEMLKVNAKALYADGRDRLDFQATIGRERFVKDYEVRFVSRDGRVLDCLETASLQISDDGSVIGYQGIIRDITARKQVEATLKKEKAFSDAVLDSLPGLLYLFDREGTFLRWNRNAELVTGYSAEEVENLRPTDLFEGDDRRRIQKCINEIFDRGKAATEAHLVCKDGTPLPYLFSGRRVNLGDKLCVLGLAIDMSERRQLEHELRQSQKMEAIGQLAGGVAHDFNNVLTVILANVDFLLRDLGADDPRTEEVGAIRDAAERAASLTRQLLAFSRKQMLQPRMLSLNAVVLSMETMLRRLIGEDIRLSTVLGPDIWTIEADPGQLEQVILNLAVNSREALPHGGTLTLETLNKHVHEGFAATHYPMAPGDYVLLVVSDNGLGMSPEVRSRVFEPFFTTKPKSEGTGLGLSTVFGIVKQSGGYIWAESEVGRGTTFKIYLPRFRQGEPAETLSGEMEPQAVNGSETVLVVEDEESVRSIACRTLESRGYRVLAASNGEEALMLSEAHSGPIHLLLTDVVMPGLSGPALATQLVAQRPQMRVLFMSGYTDHPILAQEGLRRRANFLQKPFTPNHLARTVRKSLGSAMSGKGRSGSDPGRAHPS